MAETTRGEVKCAFQLLRQVLDQREEQTLANLEHYHSEKIREISAQREGAQLILNSLQTATLFASTLLNEANDLEVLETSKQLQDRLRHLGGIKNEFDSVPSCSIRFMEQNQDTLIKEIHEFGHVVCHHISVENSYLDFGLLSANPIVNQELSFIIVAIDQDGLRAKQGGQQWSVFMNGESTVTV